MVSTFERAQGLGILIACDDESTPLPGSLSVKAPGIILGQHRMILGEYWDNIGLYRVLLGING